LHREPWGSKLVINTSEQWNIIKDNFNIGSLKLYHAETEEDSYLEVKRLARGQKQENWRRGADTRTRMK
jgi:hypothetical protein